MTKPESEFNIHVNFDLPEDYVSPDEMQLVHNFFDELIAQAIQLSDSDAEVR